MKRLPWFTNLLVEQLQPFDHALLTIDQVVFDVPPCLIALRRAAGEARTVHEVPGHLFESDAEELRAVLEAALSGWIDLGVLFSPSKHALWADHDEYTTCFSESSGKIGEIRRALIDGGATMVEYTASAP